MTVGIFFLMMIVYDGVVDDDDDDDAAEPVCVDFFFSLTHRGCLAQDIMPWLQQHLGEASTEGICWCIHRDW